MEQPSQEDALYDILSQLPITEEEMQILAANGFDDIESLKFLDMNTLTQLKIQEPEQVFLVVQEILKDYEEYEINEQQQQQEYYEDYNQQQQQQQDDQINIETKPLKSITTKMIVQTLHDQQAKLSKSAAIQQGKTLVGLQLSQTLSKLTHLQLNGKKIQRIGDEMQTECKNIKVLYLFDNMIQQIEGISNLKNLIQLSLYNNQISKMEGMENLVALRRLYLEKNRISRLEGLTDCRTLEEIYLSNQDTSSAFTFDDYSLAAISRSLKYLDLSAAKVRDSKPLYYLESLEVLQLKRNLIDDFEENVVPLLQTMSSLRQLDLTDNPVTQIQKYRDQIIILTGNRLQEIDGKSVSQQERTYLMQLVQRKQRQVGAPHKEEKKASLPSGIAAKGGQFEIQGKNKALHQPAEIINQFQQMQMTGGGESYGQGGEEEDTQNHFYSPIDDIKNPQGILKARTTNITNASYNSSSAMMKKRSANINSGNDFTPVGISHITTKHIASSQMKK